MKTESSYVLHQDLGASVPCLIRDLMFLDFGSKLVDVEKLREWIRKKFGLLHLRDRAPGRAGEVRGCGDLFTHLIGISRARGWSTTFEKGVVGGRTAYKAKRVVPLPSFCRSLRSTENMVQEILREFKDGAIYDRALAEYMLTSSGMEVGWFISADPNTREMFARGLLIHLAAQPNPFELFIRPGVTAIATVIQEGEFFKIRSYEAEDRLS